MLNSLLKSLNDVEARYKEIKIKRKKKRKGEEMELNKVFHRIYPPQNSGRGGRDQFLLFFLFARRTFIQK